MPAASANATPKIIVVPRPLESFFYERLQRVYEGRDDVRVVVDRRAGERRRRRYIAAPQPLSERRGGERRRLQDTWSLPEMPFSAS